MARRSKPAKQSIIGGVDTHADTHHAAVIRPTGQRVADAQFPTTQQGYAELWEWMRSFGRLGVVGVEGTGSYGAGLCRHLCGQGVSVVEVNRPNRQQRRLVGKSDPLDAYAAAEAVVAQRATALPKLGTGIVEALRALHTVRASAVKARTATMNELHALLVTAPAELRDRLRGLSAAHLVDACAGLRPGQVTADPERATKHALRHLARRYRCLTEEITQVEAQLHPLVEQACPALLAVHGVGYETATQLLITIGDNPSRLTTEAAFAALCGVAPIPASSGKTHRHRLSRGGDRQANRALYLISRTRMASCPKTRAYVQRRTQEGLSKQDIIRCLKRYIARQVYRVLAAINPTPHDLTQPA
jgi:transposase